MFEAKNMNEELLKDDKKLFKFKDAIIKVYPHTEDNFEDWLSEHDLRIYDSLDYNVVLDSWFYTQHGFEDDFEVKDNKFIIKPSEEYIWYYRKSKLVYDNTMEGLREAFLKGYQGYQSIVDIDGKEYFICIDEF